MANYFELAIHYKAYQYVFRLCNLKFARKKNVSSLCVLSAIITYITIQNKQKKVGPSQAITSIMGIHHYYTLHRLSVQIEVPSRGFILKEKVGLPI